MVKIQSSGKKFRKTFQEKSSASQFLNVVSYVFLYPFLHIKLYKKKEKNLKK